MNNWQGYTNKLVHSNWSLVIFIVSLFIFLDYLFPILATQKGIKYVGKFQVKRKIALFCCYFFKVHTPSTQLIRVNKGVFDVVKANEVIELKKFSFHILPKVLDISRSKNPEE